MGVPLSVRSTSTDTAKLTARNATTGGHHVWLLTTTGRKSSAKRTTPLIYQRHGDDYLVVASNGGGDPAGWFLFLQDDPTWPCRSTPSTTPCGRGSPRPRTSPSFGA
jgi:deazaflavin-dependent oxidoreductase (nitroreductase family)